MAALEASLAETRARLDATESLLSYWNGNLDMIEASFGDEASRLEGLQFHSQQLQHSQAALHDLGLSLGASEYEATNRDSFVILPSVESSEYAVNPNEPLWVIDRPLVEEIEEAISILQRLARIEGRNMSMTSLCCKFVGG